MLIGVISASRATKVDHAKKDKARHVESNSVRPAKGATYIRSWAMPASTQGAIGESGPPVRRTRRRSEALIEAVVDKLRAGRSRGSNSSREQPSNRHSLVGGAEPHDGGVGALPKRRNYLIKSLGRKKNSDASTGEDKAQHPVARTSLIETGVNAQVVDEPRATRPRRLSSLLRGIGGGSSPTQVLPNDGGSQSARSRSGLSLGRRTSFRRGSREPKALSSSSASPRDEVASLSSSNVEIFKSSFEEGSPTSSFRKRRSSFASRASSEDNDQEHGASKHGKPTGVKTLVRWHLRALDKKGPGQDRSSLLDSMLEEKMADVPKGKSPPDDEVEVEDLDAESRDDVDGPSPAGWSGGSIRAGPNL